MADSSEPPRGSPGDPPPPLPPPCPPPPGPRDRFVHARAKDLRQPPARPDLLPAPKHDRTDLTKSMLAVTPAEEAQFASLEVQIGGRPALAALLNAADLPGRAAVLPGMLADPRNDTLSLAKIAAWAHVSMANLYALLKDAALVAGQVKALIRVGEKLPDVALGVMEDSIPGERVCTTCRGLKLLTDDPTATQPNPAPRICVTCGGTGTVYHQPETELRKVALQIGKLLEKPGATQNNINLPLFGAGAVRPFDSVVSEVSKTLYGTGRGRSYDFDADLVEKVDDGEVAEKFPSDSPEFPSDSPAD